MRGLIWRRGWVGVVGVVLALGSAGRGEVRVLVIGGGPDVYRNEVFFEKNVRFFREAMGRVGVLGEGRPREAVLFAGGGDVGAVPDIAYRGEEAAVPRVNRLLARIFEGRGDVEVEYRPHEVKGVAGAATNADITKWFGGEGKKLKDGDVLFIYVTTHGGGSPRPLEVGRSTIALWGDDSMGVGDFVGLLDQLPAGVRVVCVMVQCYCGGFGEMVFRAGLPPGRVSPQVRCGFFATLSTLTATGCTEETREETYADYSTYFFAGLSGVDRTGRVVPMEKRDLDGDGRVSMAEAHWYAVTEAPSVDVPTTTSELYLRRVSKMDGNRALRGETYEGIRARAGAVRGKVMEELGEGLGLGERGKGNVERPTSNVQRTTGGGPATAPRRGAGTRAVATTTRATTTTTRVAATRPAGDWIDGAFAVVREAERDKREIEGRKTKAWERYREARTRIATDVQARWPELAVSWHPRLAELLGERAGEVVKAIEGDASYAEFERARVAWNGLVDEEERADVRRVRAQRLLRTAATVALEGHLGELAPAEREEYRRLVEAEGRGF